ncbi:MAG TPA: hypothetical protein VFR79_04590 [Nitrospira sp.]|nr:hypothetical protein [Nitrospira sp.]
MDKLDQIVTTADEFDRTVSQALPFLLDRAAEYIKAFLRETGQWKDDVAHEKFVLRWGAEYLEQFLVLGRNEVPCRPLFLLDAVVARQHSKPEPFCYHPDLMTPLGQVIDGLLGRASVSRDALVALYHHCYGLGPGQVIGVLGLNGPDGHRIYKNFRRWRDSGWQRTMEDMGISDATIQRLCDQQEHNPQQFNFEAERILRVAQAHYRKSEPNHYRCFSVREGEEMYREGYGFEYRIWHYAQCPECLCAAWEYGFGRDGSVDKPKVMFHIRP